MGSTCSRSGRETATAVGVEVARLRRRLYVVTSLIAGVAVAVSGIIGFVGLVIPHILRLSLGNDHRVTLPVGLLWGAAFMVTADLLARVVVAPRSCPSVWSPRSSAGRSSCSSSAGAPTATGQAHDPQHPRPVRRHRGPPDRLERQLRGADRVRSSGCSDRTAAASRPSSRPSTGSTGRPGARSWSTASPSTISRPESGPAHRGGEPGDVGRVRPPGRGDGDARPVRPQGPVRAGHRRRLRRGA